MKNCEECGYYMKSSPFKEEPNLAEGESGTIECTLWTCQNVYCKHWVFED